MDALLGRRQADRGARRRVVAKHCATRKQNYERKYLDMKKIFALMLVVMLLAVGLTACKKAEQKADEAAATVEETAEEAAETVEEAAEEAAETVEETAEETTEAAEEAVEEGAEAVEEAAEEVTEG